MRRRTWFFGWFGICTAVACVDLFHDTDRPLPPADAGVDAPVVLSPKDRAINACARLVACQQGFGSPTGECITNAILAYDPTAAPNRPLRGATKDYWTCLDAAKSCDDVSTCIFGGPAPACSDERGDSYTQCLANDTGGVRLNCTGPLQRVQADPCIATGRRCSSTAVTEGFCTATAKVGCPDAGCTGTVLHECYETGGNTYDLGIDCAAFGDGTCVERPDASPVCKPSSNTTCSPASDSVTCTGPKAYGCPSGFPEVVDCSAFPGATCTPPTGGKPRDVARACRNSEPACTQDECLPDGNLQACVGGYKVQIDCRAIGLGACENNWCKAAQ
jgi:hypothetical protein